MINTLNKINEKLQNIARYVAVFLLFVIIISTSVQVFTRYVLDSSLVGTEEVSRYCFIWATMLGAAICVSSFSHASVSFVPDMLKGRIKLINTCIIQALMMVLAVIFIVQGVKMVGITINQLSPTLKVPMWLVYSAVPVGGVMILLASLCNIINSVFCIKPGGVQ
ncbi:TRAP transporter small permease [Sedimentibacter sp.]|uniref:TRAP transporter small permease n=1 Tax=Sedimentibacter sp. TaxID=1960295 RepID=UPI0028973B08|nr:TRAP transporter small permease [Sedimentibacter sp.]